MTKAKAKAPAKKAPAKAKTTAPKPEPERDPTLQEQTFAALEKLKAVSTSPEATQDERAAATTLLRQIELEQDDARLRHLTGLA